MGSTTPGGTFYEMLLLDVEDPAFERFSLRNECRQWAAVFIRHEKLAPRQTLAEAERKFAITHFR